MMDQSDATPCNPRVEFAGVVYHVMCRGDRGEDMFADDVDRLLKTLWDVRTPTG